jgi:hypothetical protein
LPDHPAENRLTVAIRAGEKSFGKAHDILMCAIPMPCGENIST